jgi:phage/plasmid-associated DNA primase
LCQKQGKTKTKVHLFLATNEPPDLTGAGKAGLNRLRIFQMYNTFVDPHAGPYEPGTYPKDAAIDDRLKTPAALAGLVRLMLAGCARWTARGKRFALAANYEEILEHTRHFADFIAEKYEVVGMTGRQPDGHLAAVNRKDVYDDWSSWRIGRSGPLTPEKFYSNFKASWSDVLGFKRTTIYTYGVRRLGVDAIIGLIPKPCTAQAPAPYPARVRLQTRTAEFP